MLMLNFFLFISTLVLYSFDNAHCKKTCSIQEDCMTIPLCPGAQRLVAYRRQNPTITKQFIHSFCGIAKIGKRNVPMVCCSDFEVINGSDAPTSRNRQAEDEEIDFTEHTNIELIPKVCGIHIDDRINGGQLAELYEFTWMALISIVNEETNGSKTIYFGCGGSIINSKYILTAAQCVDNRQVLGVRLGEYDISRGYDCQGEYPRFFCENHIQDVEIEKKIIHENYHLVSIRSNNIALLRVKDEINFNFRNVAPICLPVYKGLIKSKLSGKIVTVAGWGVTETGHLSSRLSKLAVPVLPDAQCDESDRRMIICAGGSGRNTCRGDSGGPLMLMDEYNSTYRIIQYGIVSGPEECSNSPKPGIYTDVRKYMRWILDNIEE